MLTEQPRQQPMAGVVLISNRTIAEQMFSAKISPLVSKHSSIRTPAATRLTAEVIRASITCVATTAMKAATDLSGAHVPLHSATSSILRQCTFQSRRLSSMVAITLLTPPTSQPVPPCFMRDLITGCCMPLMPTPIVMALLKQTAVKRSLPMFLQPYTRT